MKFAQIMGLYTIILASTLTSSQAWLHKEIFKKEADAETTTFTIDTEAVEQAFEGTPGLCNNYWMLSRDLRDCLNVTTPRYTNSYYVLDRLSNMCAYRTDIRDCMLEKIEGCETNYDTVVGMLDTTFDYCDQYWIPIDVHYFLVTENITVTDSCIQASFDFKNMTSPQCDHFTSHGLDADTLYEKIADVNGVYWWYVKCMITNNLHEVASDACDDVTRGHVYGIFISSLPLVAGLGVNHYSKFEVFIQAYQFGHGFF